MIIQRDRIARAGWRGTALAVGRHRALGTALAVLCTAAVFAPAAQAFNPQPDPPGRQPELTSHPASVWVAPTFTVEHRQLRPVD